jgi:hypothetical protein
MIGRILEELKKGPATFRELTRRLELEPAILKQVLELMAQKGLVKPVRPECTPKACPGCPEAGKCHGPTCTGYELTGRNNPA